MLDLRFAELGQDLAKFPIVFLKIAEILIKLGKTPKLASKYAQNRSELAAQYRKNNTENRRVFKFIQAKLKSQ